VADVACSCPSPNEYAPRTAWVYSIHRGDHAASQRLVHTSAPPTPNAGKKHPHRYPAPDSAHHGPFRDLPHLCLRLHRLRHARHSRCRKHALRLLLEARDARKQGGRYGGERAERLRARAWACDDVVGREVEEDAAAMGIGSEVRVTDVACSQPSPKECASALTLHTPISARAAPRSRASRTRSTRVYCTRANSAQRISGRDASVFVRTERERTSTRVGVALVICKGRNGGGR
jgi:hypothetical protein